MWVFALLLHWWMSPRCTAWKTVLGSEGCHPPSDWRWTVIFSSMKWNFLMNQSWEFGNCEGLHMFVHIFWGKLLSCFVCIWIKRIDMRGKQWTLTPIRSVLTPDWCLERSLKKLQEKADEATLASEKDIKWKISLQKNMLIKIFKYVTLFLHKYFHICKQIHACFLAYIKFTQKKHWLCLEAFEAGAISQASERFASGSWNWGEASGESWES